MASIVWTDSTGTATLENAHAGTTASRFANWRPLGRAVGEKATGLGDGARHSFTFRQDYLAAFELRDIPESAMLLMDRLARHLDAGGTITVNTGDAASRTYTCTLAPGAEPPDPEMTDERERWYRLTFTLLNAAATPTAMILGY